MTLTSSHVAVRNLQVPKVPDQERAHAIFWLFKKEESFEPEESIFDFEVVGETSVGRSRKTAVVAYTTPKQEIQTYQSAFQEAGFPLEGITLPLFAVRNLKTADWVPGSPKTFVLLFIGNDHSEIVILPEQGSELISRTVNAGFSSLTEALSEGLEEPVNSRRATELLARLDQPTSGNRADDGPSPQQILDIVLPALRRLVRNIDRTSRYYAVNVGPDEDHEVFLAGAITPFTSLIEHIRRELGIGLRILNPLVDRGPDTGEPAEASGDNSGASYSLASAAALSGFFPTPNILVPYEEKENQRRSYSLHKGIFAMFLVLLAVLASFHFLLAANVKKKAGAEAELKKTVQGFPAGLDEATIRNLELAWELNAKAEVALSKEYVGLAVVREVLDLTPKGIHILDISLLMGKGNAPAAEPTKEKTSAKTEKGSDAGPGVVTGAKTLHLKGVVSGSKERATAALMSYLLRLEHSRLLQRPAIKESRTEHPEQKYMRRFRGDCLLFFTVQAEFAAQT